MLSTHKLILTSLSKKESTITESASINTILNDCDKDIFCCFWDLDNSLEMPMDQTASDEMFEKLFESFEHYCALLKFAEDALETLIESGNHDLTKMTKQQAINTIVDISLAMKYVTPMQLVEGENTKRVINEINNKNIRNLIVTARGLEHIEITEKHLNDTDIDFSMHWPRKTIELDIGNKSKPVIYKDGIIYCNGNDKGICIKAFFDYLGIPFTGKSFGMVDDNLNNVNKVMKVVKENNGTLYATHYTYLNQYIKNFKQNFDFEKTLPQLKNRVSDLHLFQSKVALRAQRAIDKLSHAVSKTHSFFSIENNKVALNIVQYEMISQKAIPCL